MKWQETREWTTGNADVHTPENPYCDELSCWCHSDVSYHEDVTHPTATDEEIDQAQTFFGFSWR
jgi:hypothetical protein